MKTPEKIYIQPNAHDGWFEINPNSDIFVEYVRKDAFIEKAEKYLTGKFINDVSVLAGEAVHYICARIPLPLGEVIDINFDSAISNFIKYMKGE